MISSKRSVRVSHPFFFFLFFECLLFVPVLLAIVGGLILLVNMGPGKFPTGITRFLIRTFSFSPPRWPFRGCGQEKLLSSLCCSVSCMIHKFPAFSALSTWVSCGIARCTLYDHQSPSLSFVHAIMSTPILYLYSTMMSHK